MTTDTLQDHLKRQPFEPFRVVTSSGRAYDVRHPDAAILLRNGLAVAYGGNGKKSLPEHVAYLSLLHITAVEPIGAALGRHTRSR